VIAVRLLDSRRTALYWLIPVAIATIAITAAFHFDFAVRHFIAQHQHALGENIMVDISRFGDWPEHFALGLVLAGIAWWRGSKKWTRIFLAMLIALAIAGMAGQIIKFATGRARPFVKSEQLWKGPRSSSKFQSFPSGHVAESTAFFGVLFFANWRIGLLCIPIPLLIGFSRMWVAEHYLSDVLVAIVLGVVCAFMVARFFLSSPISKASGIFETKK